MYIDCYKYQNQSNGPAKLVLYKTFGPFKEIKADDLMIKGDGKEIILCNRDTSVWIDWTHKNRSSDDAEFVNFVIRS